MPKVVRTLVKFNLLLALETLSQTWQLTVPLWLRLQRLLDILEHQRKTTFEAMLSLSRCGRKELLVSTLSYNDNMSISFLYYQNSL